MSSSEEPADIDALRHEVDSLRDRNRELEERTEHKSHSATGVLRSTGVVLLLVFATLCMTLAPATIWGRNLVLNTNRYVSTLKPVASDPGVQALIIKAVDKQFDQNVDVSSLVTQVLPPKASILSGPLESAVEGLVNTLTTRYVQSAAFETTWVQMNRLAHQQLVYLLTGKVPGNGGIEVNQSSGAVVLQLAPIVTQIKAQLVAAGLTVAANIPVVGATVEVAQVKGLVQARKYVRWLNTLAWVLPILSLVLFAGAIALARRRRRALITSALCTVSAMLLLGLALLIGRHFYLNEIPVDKIPRSTAAYLFDTLVRYLRDGIRIVAVVALLVAIGAWVTGPGRHATSTRNYVVGHSKSGLAYVVNGRVGQNMADNPNPWRIGIVALMLIIFVFFTTPSWTAFIVLVVIGVLLLLGFEAMRRQVPVARPDDELAVPGSPTTPS